MSDKKTRQYIAKRLAEAGLKPHAVAGIMGNISAESSFNPNALNGSSGAFGLVQWLGGRKSGLQAYAKSKGKSASNLDVQIDYIVKEIKSGKQSGRTGTVTVDSLNRLSGPGEVAEFFDTNYERSEGTTIPARRQAAQSYLKMVRRVSGEGSEPVAKVKGSSGGEMTWVPKVGDDVSNPFGAPGDYAAGKHTGSDVPGGAGGQPIRWAPPMGGKVVKVGSSGAYGNHVIVEDEKGRQWLLAHMQDGVKVSKGDRVDQGTMIGRVGNTGNSKGAHLHIEMTAPGEKWSYGNVKKPKLVFKVGANGQTYDKDFKPVSGDFLDSVGLSGQALSRKGNEKLRALVDEAVRKEWTNLEFTRRFKKTKWYTDRAESQRTFDMLQDTDQQQRIKQRRSEVVSLAQQMGIDLDDDEARKLAIKIERDGFTQEQARWFIAKRMDYNPQEAQQGLVGSYEDRLKEIAREYGVTLGSSEMKKWIQESVGRGVDIDTYEDTIRQMAYEQNPYLRQAYDKGLTTREALSTKLSTVAEVFGVDKDSIDLTDPKWRTSMFDANGNELSDAQWRAQIKTDATYGYGYTQNGVNEAKTIGRNLLRAMGGLKNG